MVLYLVYTNDDVKVLYDEDSVAKLLTNDKINRKDISKYRIRVLEAEIKSDLTGSELLDTYQSILTRENKLDIMLGDEYAQNVQKLKDLIVESVKSSPQKVSFLSKLEITPFVKSNISKLLSGHSNFVLYEAPISLDNCLDYYKLVLKLHGFRKIEDKFVREIYNSSGYLHTRSYCMTPERCKDSFNEAKKVMSLK